MNGHNIYTMITAQPVSKPESNSSPLTTYPYTLTTTTGSSPNYIPFNLFESGLPGSTNPIYGPAQTEVDSFMRQKENQILASGARQLSQLKAAVNGAGTMLIVCETIAVLEFESVTVKVTVLMPTLE